MPSWDNVQSAIRSAGSGYDAVRRKALADLADYTKRNVILYYSGWLEKQPLVGQGLPVDVNDSDKNGFMAVIHQLDRTKGLDLILHTPGGSVAATESLVDYLRAMFGTDIRAIVPQLAMSAGTMIALSTKSVVMGKHSSLGPIDPQIMGTPAHGIVEEFNQAKTEIANNPATMAVWQPIIAKYPPTYVGECQKAIDWADRIVKEWLETGMFAGEADPKAAAEKVNKELADHALTLSHDRHISAEKAADLGITVELLENDQELQDRVLTVHHASSLTISETPAFKIIENQNGVSQISMVNVSPVRTP
ncbi:serine protease [Mycobacterium paraintracellulare]|uniref:SDH family Clp fold serine proteinase n=1 Tax=Mycobacterium paraintracellulare TaxID=1138383 RepID=UPI001934FB57|nr:ATP-dependent Clp protease proteolytic subunit [Mycobacterium paraintracellulare]BCO43897.1 serine protease [Mycobacterium paraintracellulare]